MVSLTSKQRKVLEKAAHHLEPVVIVGQDGVSDGVRDMCALQLAKHELIKIKFIAFKEEKRNLSEALASSCDATLVRVIGNVAILYRENEDAEKRQFYGLLAKA